MSFLLISTLKDFKRRLKDPVALLMWLGIPLLIGGLLGLVIGGPGGSVTPKAVLLFVDQDDSLVTKLIVGAVESGGEDSMVELVPLDLEEGRRRIDAGEGSALLVIPDGFGQALLDGSPIELKLVTNPAQRILPGILEEGLEMLVEVAFYLQQLLGDELATFAEGPGGDSSFFSSAIIAARAASINERLSSLEGVLFPPLLDFEMEVIETDEAPADNLGLLLFPGILFLSMLFIAQGMSGDLWTERNAGTLQRAVFTPAGLWAFLFGKYLAGGFMIACVTALGLGVGAFFFDFPASGLLPALAWGAFSGLILLSLFMWLQILATSQQAGNVLSSVLLFPLMMLGGSLFPYEAMPDWMIVVGQWTPNGMANARFKGLLTGDVEFALLARSAGILLTFGVVMSFMTIRRVNGRFLNS